MAPSDQDQDDFKLTDEYQKMPHVPYMKGNFITSALVENQDTCVQDDDLEAPRAHKLFKAKGPKKQLVSAASVKQSERSVKQHSKDSKKSTPVQPGTISTRKSSRL